MKETRPHLRSTPYGKLTQGTIFSCAKAAKFKGCEVYGLTITARCDVAQSKFPVLNYIPVVTLKDWLRRDGLDILVDQERGEQSGLIRRLLKQASVSDALLTSVSLQKIAEVHFPENIGTKPQKTAAANIRKLINVQQEFEGLRTGNNPEAMFEWFLENRASKIKDIVHRLSKHSILGHYLLETLSLNEGHASGFVCLLREVSTLPKMIADRLGKGIDSETYSDLIEKDGSSIHNLDISNDELAMPIVEVGSPTIEHILQSFANLFGRIGVADPVDQTISDLVNQCVAETRTTLS